MVKCGSVPGGTKANHFPCQGQRYVEKLNKLSIYDYSFVRIFDNSALSTPCPLSHALIPSFLRCFLTAPVKMAPFPIVGFSWVMFFASGKIVCLLLAIKQTPSLPLFPWTFKGNLIDYITNTVSLPTQNTEFSLIWNINISTKINEMA